MNSLTNHSTRQENKKMVESTDRVRIWNSFFKLAWNEAKILHDASAKKTSKKEFNPLGGTLSHEEHHILSTMALCNLAIEARANHLIQEMVEEGKITQAEGEAASRIPTKHKWFLLPKLASAKAKLDDSSSPHQAVVQICSLRNNLLHVNYAGLQKQLPKRSTALSLFKKFVEAMEDMNVVLGRHEKPKKEVLEIGKF